MFLVHSEEKNYECFSLKKVKNTDKILVGDRVEFFEDSNKFVIEKIYPRINKLVRPFVVNVTKLFIVVCQVPKTDLILVDKLIINAKMNNITPIILINKCDENSEDYVNDIEDYFKLSDVKIIKTSSKTKQNFNLIFNELKNNLCCMSGQSAVGKSSLINALTNLNKKVGEYSYKLKKGKNTTTDSEILVLNNNAFLVDTPGFSQITLNIEPNKIKNYYNEFDNFKDECEFSNCSHIVEGKHCGIIKNSNKLKRYNNYVKIYSECEKNFKRY